VLELEGRRLPGLALRIDPPADFGRPRPRSVRARARQRKYEGDTRKNAQTSFSHMHGHNLSRRFSGTFVRAFYQKRGGHVKASEMLANCPLIR